MRKLYKTIKGRVKYWEAWPADSKLVVHTGWLGHWGRAEQHAIERGESNVKAIARIAAPVIAEGYAPIEDSDHKLLVVQKALATWGTVDDLDTRTQIEAIANEWLGWTGNGRCDGGDIGSGTINVFCFVIDPVCATKTLVTELRKAKLLADVTIAYSNTDAVTARMKIGHPTASRKRFSILGHPQPTPRPQRRRMH